MSENLPRPSIWVIIPPPLWALLFMGAAWGAGRLLGAPVLFLSPLAGLIVFVVGFAISASGRLAFARAGTEVIPASKKNSALVTSGPFGFTRNPMYLGILVALAGIFLAIGTLPALIAVAAFFVFVNFVSIPYEEAKMEAQFGDDYRAYKRRVRRWI